MGTVRHQRAKGGVVPPKKRKHHQLGQPPLRVSSRGAPGGPNGGGGGGASVTRKATRSSHILAHGSNDGHYDRADPLHDHHRDRDQYHDELGSYRDDRNPKPHKLTPTPTPTPTKQQQQHPTKQVRVPQPQKPIEPSYPGSPPRCAPPFPDPDPSISFTTAFPATNMIIERKVKLVTEQHNIPKPPQLEGYPMKEWTVELYILDEAGKERPARCFQKVVYNLHPSFENPIQTFHEPPFTCRNEGWGEFEMTIDCFTTEKGGKQTIAHDLNFAKASYENIHTVQFKNPSQALQAILRETGPIPTDDDRRARKAHDTVVKKRKAFDLEKMADAIYKLGEDDLLHIIQLIHDNKSDDTYIVNNPDAGEFSIDLYTMPDSLCRLMWDFLLQTQEAHRLK